MKKEIKKTILCLFLAALFAIPGGCVFRPAPAKTADGDVLFRIGFSGAPDSINPYAAGNKEAAAIVSLLYDTLFSMDPESGDYIPGLCSDYSVGDSAAGAKLWRITLRDDVYWHDGERLTASDVEFSLQSSKELSSFYGYPDCELLDVTGIAVEDETHLAMVVWGEEDVIKAGLARVPILPRHVWNTPDYMSYDSSGVASDPLRARKELYSLTPDDEWMVGSGLYRWGGLENGVCTLKLNEKYWNGTAEAQVIKLHFGLADPAAEIEAGRIDACWEMPLSSYQRLSETDGFRITAGAPGEMYMIGFNYRKASSPVSDAHVRQALEYCTGREAILLYAFGGGFSERGMLSPFSPYYYMDKLMFDRPYSIETAGVLLENAGYTDKNSDGVRENAQGVPLSLRLLCSSGSDAWITAAEILQTSCSAAGLELQIQRRSPEECTDAILSGDYDLVLTSIQTRPEPWFSLGGYYWDGGDNAYAGSDVRGGSVSRGWNESGYQSEAYDRLFENLLAAADPSAVAQLTAQAGEFLYNDSAMIVIGFAVDYQACSRVWFGLRPCVWDGLYFSLPALSKQMQNMRTG